MDYLTSRRITLAKKHINYPYGKIDKIKKQEEAK